MPSNSDWEGRTVFVLALAVGIGFVIAVFAIAKSPMPFGGDSARALSAGFGALIGIVAGYVLGHRPGHRRHRRQEEDDE